MAWTVDPAHSRVGFAVRHMMLTTVRGEFTRFQGQLDLDEQDPTRSQAEGSIEAASLDTGNAERDAHVRGPEFFDVERFPTLGFRSRRIEHRQGELYRVEGELTMHGVTHLVTLEAQLTPAGRDPWGATRRGITLSGTLKRSDYGLVWNQALEAGGVLLDDTVRLEVDLEVVQAAPAPAPELANAEATRPAR